MSARKNSFDIPSLLALWMKFSRYRWGKWLFSRLVGRVIPYTGSVYPDIISLKPGEAVVQIQDRRAVRNHLNSIHAMALANAGEFATGLAILSGLSHDSRGILVGFSIEYLKKARGTITVSSQIAPVSSMISQDIEVPGELKDASGAVVARVRGKWRIGPVKP